MFQSDLFPAGEQLPSMPLAYASMAAPQGDAV